MHFRRLVVSLVVFLAFSCGKDSVAEQDSERLRQLEQEILAFIQDKACTGDRVCGTIAFGAKPCGGPWKYLVYSLKAADVATLEQKVKGYNELNGSINKRQGLSSDCALVVPPAVSCQDGQCKPNTNQ